MNDSDMLRQFSTAEQTGSEMYAKRNITAAFRSLLPTLYKTYIDVWWTHNVCFIPQLLSQTMCAPTNIWRVTLEM